MGNFVETTYTPVDEEGNQIEYIVPNVAKLGFGKASPLRELYYTLVFVHAFIVI